MRRARGVTLVELLVVVLLLGLGTLALRFTAADLRGERVSDFARGLLNAAQQTRHAALTQGLWTRLRLAPGAAATALFQEGQDPQSVSTWLQLGAAPAAASGIQICQVTPRAVLTSAAPGCPLLVQTSVCFSPAGQASVSTDGTCPGPTPGSGATLYLNAISGAPAYRVIVFGLTGMPRLVSSW